ncbi:hypothetical protein CYMTET_53744 [Cymbomonas tetramitiformis]|uniref:Uncharacterized protein n=1 Tax=Cymbomonas tetramitiformis TaxID=36881 RepID=A0AAE0EQ22_9CHLO|nr:hypothetical protein CYMTET_53744 [Cymbomonas tetramitiformis]
MHAVWGHVLAPLQYLLATNTPAAPEAPLRATTTRERLQIRASVAMMRKNTIREESRNLLAGSPPLTEGVTPSPPAIRVESVEPLGLPSRHQSAIQLPRLKLPSGGSWHPRDTTSLPPRDFASQHHSMPPIPCDTTIDEDAKFADVTTRSRSRQEIVPSPTPSAPHSPSPPGVHGVKTNTSPAPSPQYENVVDRYAWKLVKEKFEEIMAQFGPFDVDACCNSMGVN